MQRRDFIAGGLTGGVVGALAGLAGRIGWERRQPVETGPRVPEFARLSFSQQGEDIVLYHALHDLMQIEKPTYMDVGAAHPRKSNNTYLLYGTGSRGVLVEPNPAFVELIRRERPKDAVVAAGIGVSEMKEADYYVIKGNPMLNTFSPDQVKMLQAGKTEDVVERVMKMPLLNINDVIAAQLGKAPDLLSTDVEGLDYAILQTLDLSRFRPAVICAEGQGFDTSGATTNIAAYLTGQGYIQRGGSMVNTIFVDARRLKAGDPAASAPAR
jgi:FkbM family methyltransferase